jgi:hypothetical protein
MRPEPQGHYEYRILVTCPALSPGGRVDIDPDMDVE